MVKTVSLLKEELKEYSCPINKINRMVKDGTLIPLVKGVYETNRNAHPFTLARSICSPSYISFESALSYYGLIPERVYTITSASMGKSKSKEYTNYFGTYTYKDIPARVYPLGVKIVEIGDKCYCQMATKEKAICDKLYKCYIVNNYKELEELLFDNLRIDWDTLIEDINIDDLKDIALHYHSNNVTLFYRYLKRKNK
ncbi:MAG: hypothetical protein K5906_00810 [Bacilli bacterium]|nr:hypothetical protein [Bacilli bacterium]